MILKDIRFHSCIAMLFPSPKALQTKPAIFRRGPRTMPETTCAVPGENVGRS